MSTGRKALSDNLRRVREGIAAATERAGRDPAGVCLVAVTKAAECDDVKNLIDLGVLDIGESRVQQLVARSEQIAQ